MTVTAEPDALMERAAALIAAGRIGVARPVLAAARQTMAPQPRLAELSALLEMRGGDLAAASAALDRDIVAWPGHTGLRKLRAELRLHRQDLPGALEDAADCVLQDPHDPTAKALLGMLLLEAGHAPDAIACLGEAMAAMPGDAGFAQALAAAQEAAGDADAAVGTLRDCIARTPDDVALRNAAILLCVRQRNFSGAVDMAEAARRHGVGDACLFGLLGHALSSLGRHAEASDAYGEALKLGPDDPYVRHLVAASGVVAGAARAPDDYVRTVFDGYAGRFEEHLIGLGYRVPGLVRAALLRHRPGLLGGVPLGPVLDLGCGTGMVGVALSDLPLRDLTGVDLSSRMLAVARSKQLYASLQAQEIGAYLQGVARRFPVIVAADVLCYFGDLRAPLAGIARRLEPGGLCILSVEERTGVADGQGWALGRQGRYAHDAAYVAACAASAGLRTLEQSREALRQEAGAPVPGLLFVLEHAA